MHPARCLRTRFDVSVAVPAASHYTLLSHSDSRLWTLTLSEVSALSSMTAGERVWRPMAPAWGGAREQLRSSAPARGPMGWGPQSACMCMGEPCICMGAVDVMYGLCLSRTVMSNDRVSFINTLTLKYAQVHSLQSMLRAVLEAVTQHGSPYGTHEARPPFHLQAVGTYWCLKSRFGAIFSVGRCPLHPSAAALWHRTFALGRCADYS